MSCPLVRGSNLLSEVVRVSTIKDNHEQDVEENRVKNEEYTKF